MTLTSAILPKRRVRLGERPKIRLDRMRRDVVNDLARRTMRGGLTHTGGSVGLRSVIREHNPGIIRAAHAFVQAQRADALHRAIERPGSSHAVEHRFSTMCSRATRVPCTLGRSPDAGMGDLLARRLARRLRQSPRAGVSKMPGAMVTAGCHSEPIPLRDRRRRRCQTIPPFDAGRRAP